MKTCIQMKWRFSCILLFFLAALFVTPIAVSEGIGTVYGESAGEVSSASYISISPGVSSAVSLEVSSEAIDFGRLAPGESSENCFLSISNIGNSDVSVTVEVVDTADDLYVAGIMVDNAHWSNYSKILSSNNPSATLDLMLEVPEYYTGTGVMEGTLVFWAEARDNKAPVLDPVGNRSVRSSEILEIELSASDPDGDFLEYSTDVSYGSLNHNIFTWDTTGVEAGVYKVVFLVSDGSSTDSEDVWITVTKSNDVTEPDNPTASFTSNITSGKAPLTVRFTDTSVNATQWQWDFGDGNGSALQNPVHTYSFAGEYNVSLTAGNSAGNDTKIKAGYITVYPNITFSPTSSSVKNSVGDSRTFTVHADELMNVSWLLDGNILYTNSSVLRASYHNSSANAGTHNVTVIIKSEHGNARNKWEWVVSEPSSSSSGGRSSGGRTGGGSYGEAYENILHKETRVQQVMANKITTYAFVDDESPVYAISFIALQNSGSVAATIEILKNTSGLVSAQPSGMVYNNMNIWVGNTGFANQDNIENAEIDFRVAKDWISDNNIAKSSIRMNHYADGNWVGLSTQKTSEDNEYVYFEAITSGFSPFAITGSVLDDKSFGTGGDGFNPLSTSQETAPLVIDGSEKLQPPESGIWKYLVFVLLVLVFLVGAFLLVSKNDLTQILAQKSGKYENVFFKENQEQTAPANSLTSFEFNNETNPITYLKFMSLESEGKISTQVELLRDTSGLVREKPFGFVYQNLNIWVGDAGEGSLCNIKDSVIGFKVKKAWVEENSYDPSLIALLRYVNDRWTILKTAKIGEDADYINYESFTSGFSSCAIVAFTVAE